MEITKSNYYHNQQVSLFERVSFALGDVGIQYLNVFVISYLMIYLTDIVNLPAAQIGTIMLICNAFDGITDLGMGYIIDRTNSRFGRAKPWVIFTAPFLSLLVILLFNFPIGLNESQKLIYFAVVFLLFNAIFGTANNIAFNSLTSFISNDQLERSKVSALKFIFSVTAGFLVGGYTPVVMKYLGEGGVGFSRIAIFYGLIGSICLIIAGIVVKERNIDKNQTLIKSSFITTVKLLIRNKHFILIFCYNILIYIRVSSVRSAIYYATYILGNPEYMKIISFASLIPAIFTLALYPNLTRSFGIRKTLLGSVFICFVGYAIMALFPSNIYYFTFGLSLLAIGGGPLGAAGNVLIAGVGDRIYKESNIAVQSATFSVNSAGLKIGTGIAGALVGWILQATNYVPNALTQPVEAVNGIKFLYIYFPAITTVAILIVILLMKMDTDI